MSTDLEDRVNARERAIHNLLRAVDAAVEKWARQSNDGTLVWDVATEHLHGVWAEWELVYDADTWFGASALIRALDTLAEATGSAEIAEAVARAKSALNNYSE